jgi:23S rRNA pseudouridine1911/1915/1917 synthase
MPLDVLYEDDEIIAVNKPAGLVVHPGSGNRTGTLVNALLYHTAELAGGFSRDRPGIVHRLDKDTSGVLLAARTDQAHAELARQFAEREVAKVYYGFCVGLQPPASGLIEAAIGRSRRDPSRFSVRGGGKASATEYECIAWHSGIAFVRFQPRTGRTHQIRVHASHAGFPVLADNVYGGGRDAVMKLEPLERPFAHSVLKCFTRHALHAFSISVHHPRTGKQLAFTAPFPQDFVQAAALFGDRVQLAAEGRR